MKVLKFGGSSLADHEGFNRIKDIVASDPMRTVVVVSAPGKRYSADNKITDLLYICTAHIRYKVSYDDIWNDIKSRYLNIILGQLAINIERGRLPFHITAKSQNHLYWRGSKSVVFSSALQLNDTGNQLLDGQVRRAHSVYRRNYAAQDMIYASVLARILDTHHIAYALHDTDQSVIARTIVAD